VLINFYNIKGVGLICCVLGEKLFEINYFLVGYKNELYLFLKYVDLKKETVVTVQN